MEDSISGVDVPTLINMFVGGIVTFIFTVIAMQIKYGQEKKLLRLQFEQKINELQQQIQREDQLRLRRVLLEGLDDPDARIQALVELGNKLRVERFSTHAEIIPESYALPILERVIQFLFNPKSTSN